MGSEKPIITNGSILTDYLDLKDPKNTVDILETIHRNQVKKFKPG